MLRQIGEDSDARRSKIKQIVEELQRASEDLIEFSASCERLADQIIEAATILKELVHKR